MRATVSYVLLPKRSRYYVRLAVERDGRDAEALYDLFADPRSGGAEAKPVRVEAKF